MSPAAALALLSDYDFLARPSQREPPGNWFVWLLLGGRGAGKTWVGSQMVNRWAKSHRVGKILLAGATPEDVRDIQVSGPSGILTLADPAFRPRYEPSKKRLTWPNGCVAHIRSGAEPERFRGLNSEKAWLDELCAWSYPAEAWSNAMLGLRLGQHPQAVVTTTPKPIAMLRELVKNPTCVVTRDTSHANRANLSDDWWTTVVGPLEGTRLGRQEIDAELLLDVPGALWTYSMLEACRLPADTDLVIGRDVGRTIIAVDPAVTSSDSSNNTGIIVCAAGIGAWKDKAFVYRDLSGRYSPTEWANIVCAAYHQFQADRVIAEENQGGDLVQAALRVVDPTISYKGVKASKGKRARAEPVAALYEQHRVYHVGDGLKALEAELLTFVPDEREAAHSPDRADAAVWGLTELMLAPRVFLL